MSLTTISLIDPYEAAGEAAGICRGREHLSYALDISAPSAVSQTSASSSPRALTQACSSASSSFAIATEEESLYSPFAIRLRYLGE